MNITSASASTESTESTESHNSPGYNENFEAPSPEPHNSPGYNENFEAPSSKEVSLNLENELLPDKEKEEEIKTTFYNLVSLYYNYKRQYETTKEKMKQILQTETSPASPSSNPCCF